MQILTTLAPQGNKAQQIGTDLEHSLQLEDNVNSHCISNRKVYTVHESFFIMTD